MRYAARSRKKAPRAFFVSFLRWFDTSGADDRIRPEEFYKIDWLRFIPFFGMHLACLGILWVGWSPVAVATAVAFYFLRMFAITGFYHRYFSHRTFKTSRLAQFVFALLGSSAVQKGPLWWAAEHRKHHRHSDQSADIHSPNVHSLLWSHMLWVTCKGSFKTDYHEVQDLAKYPELRLLNRYDTAVPVLLAVLLFFVGLFLQKVAPGLGTSAGQMLIWGFFVSTVVVFHCTSLVNSMAHRVGWRRYNTTDHSRNNLLLALLVLGEGWHNNHHHYPATVRQGFYWWEVDITYYLLVLLAKCGIIWDLKPVPQHVRDRR